MGGLVYYYKIDVDGSYDHIIINKESSYSGHGRHFLESNVIVAVFPLHRRDSLQALINTLIPHVEQQGAKKTILLVGVRSDEITSCPLFPSAFGPILAGFMSAVKYAECSLDDEDSKYKVFQEAVRARFIKNLNPTIASVDTLCPPDFSPKWCCVLLEFLVTQLSQNVIFIPKQDVNDGLAACSSLLYMVDCSEEKSHEKIFKQIDNLKTLETSLSRDSLSQDASLYFLSSDCNSVVNVLHKVGPLTIRSLTFINCTGTLPLTYLLSAFTKLKHLVIVNTRIDNTNLFFPLQARDTLECLIMNQCELNSREAPPEIGQLTSLRVLNIAANNFKMLPKELGNLQELDTLLLDTETMVFPPANVLSKPTKDIITYLEAIMQDKSVTNNRAKLIIVGQEGVGKSTLIKA